MKRLQDLEDQQERRDAEQRKANLFAKSMPPDDEDEEMAQFVADLRRLAGLAPVVPESKQVQEDFDHSEWAYIKTFLRETQTNQRDILRSLVRISVSLEKIATSEGRRR